MCSCWVVMSVYGDNHTNEITETAVQCLVVMNFTLMVKQCWWLTSKTEYFRSHKCRTIKIGWWGKEWLQERDEAKLNSEVRPGSPKSRAPVIYIGLCVNATTSYRAFYNVFAVWTLLKVIVNFKKVSMISRL